MAPITSLHHFVNSLSDWVVTLAITGCLVSIVLFLHLFQADFRE